MKRVSDYARGIRQLYQTLLRRHGRPRIPSLREPIDELMYAVLARWGPETRAASLVDQLRKSTIDLNDLRVTPVIELTETIGNSFSRPREAAEALSRVVNGAFNRRYTLDLTYLKTMSRRDVAKFLSGLSGSSPHDVALYMLRNHRVRMSPITPDCLTWLKQSGLADPTWTHAHMQSFLQRVIPASGAEAFCYLLKRHVAANPLPPAPVEPAVKPPEPRADPAKPAPRNGPPTKPATARSKPAAPKSEHRPTRARSERGHKRRAPRPGGRPKPAKPKRPVRSTKRRRKQHSPRR